MLQQQAPDRKRRRREQGEVKQQGAGRRAQALQAPARRLTRRRQNQAADQQLPAGHHHRIEIARQPFAIDGGRRQHEGGDDNEAFALQGEIEADTCGAVQIDRHHAHEADQAAQRLAPAQPVVGIDEVGQNDAEKDAGRIHDRGLHARRVRQSDVEEDILYGRLGQAQQGDLAELAAAHGHDRPFHRQRRDQQDGSGQGEPPSREQDLAGGVRRRDMQQGIAALDRRKGAAPQGAAQRGQQEDPGAGSVGGGAQGDGF